MSDSFCEEISPDIHSKPPLTQLEAVASHPIASYVGEETNTRLTTTSFQVVVESNKVPPQPPQVPPQPPSFRRERATLGPVQVTETVYCFYLVTAWLI